MKLHPFEECADAALRLIIEKGVTIHQQWNCAHCGVKQTMEEANKFFTRGICEGCGKETDIQRDGCNYMVYFHRMGKQDE